MRIMVGAGALSMKKLKYTPRKALSSDIHKASNTMLWKRRVSKNAVAPGAISIAITKIIPTALSAATIANDSNESKP